MCGIVGMAGRADAAVLTAMRDALRHRGPDDEGVFLAPGPEIGLGHTRLAILDLSPAGHQPMATPDGRVVIVYNGEIYNHLDIRQELAGKYAFSGHSDTETILYAYLEWGRDCVTRFNGMFAFALWDDRNKELWLARDRFGVKPLYYSVDKGRLRFASEIRGILADPAWPRELNLKGVDAYLRLRYLAAPHTLVAGIQALPAGHELIWRDGHAETRPYWTLPETGHVSLPASEARERFYDLMDASVHRALLSDVPVGVFLSGGLDSSLVTALAARALPQKVQTFTVSFDGDDDDAVAARQVAGLLGCDHHEIHCRPADLARLPDVVERIDQPVGDAVILPTFLLSEATRSHVKTVLTGEGADELLMGYAHQAQLMTLRRLAPVLGMPGVATALRLASHVLPPDFWSLFLKYGASLGRAGVERLLLLVSEIRSATHRYLNFATLYDAAERQALYAGDLRSLAAQVVPAGLEMGALERGDISTRSALHRFEFRAWLPDNILTKQDNLSMANGVEGRVPFLDHRLADEVLSWDDATFAAVAGDKDVLRRQLAALMPALPRRKKRAFRLDTHGAYQAVLVKMVRDRLLGRSDIIRGLINPRHIEVLLRDLDASPFIRGKQLINIVILDIWLKRNLA